MRKYVVVVETQNNDDIRSDTSKISSNVQLVIVASFFPSRSRVSPRYVLFQLVGLVMAFLIHSIWLEDESFFHTMDVCLVSLTELVFTVVLTYYVARWRVASTVGEVAAKIT